MLNDNADEMQGDVVTKRDFVVMLLIFGAIMKFVFWWIR